MTARVTRVMQTTVCRVRTESVATSARVAHAIVPVSLLQPTALSVRAPLYMVPLLVSPLNSISSCNTKSSLPSSLVNSSSSM